MLLLLARWCLTFFLIAFLILLLPSFLFSFLVGLLFVLSGWSSRDEKILLFIEIKLISLKKHSSSAVCKDKCVLSHGASLHLVARCPCETLPADKKLFTGQGVSPESDLTPY